jgi:glycosyltransferase involved in cell wall biosynthesis
MTLGILYHMPFWRAADGSLWELEGSFARYVDSLAPYFERVVLAVPMFDSPQAAGSRLRAGNVSVAALPYFDGPRQFYPQLPEVRRRLRAWARECDIINLRVPTPAGFFAYRESVRAGKRVFLLVVGDYEALLPHLPFRGWKRQAFAAYVAFEEWALRRMVTDAMTFANGAALRRKHEQQGARVIETQTTTLSLDDIATRDDTCGGPVIRLLTVSRVDPRKGLSVLPAAVSHLVQSGIDVTLDIVGPAVGQMGEAEARAVTAESRRLDVTQRVCLRGALPLDELLPMYRNYDIFVLPTRPGEGIPRVLMEAMAAGMPVVTTNVAGITSLITDGVNGRLTGGSGREVADTLREVITNDAERRRLIAGGYETARAHTLERQAATMMAAVAAEFGLQLRQEPRLA